MLLSIDHVFFLPIVLVYLPKDCHFLKYSNLDDLILYNLNFLTFKQDKSDIISHALTPEQRKNKANKKRTINFLLV